MSRRRLALVTALLVMGTGAGAAYAALPSTNLDPTTVPLGTLAAKTGVNVLSVDAFTQAITHGPNLVLQHGRFTANQSTGWHSHPGPQFVLVVSGSLTLTDNHCNVTTYGPGQGFATGLDVHQAVAGPDGADFYSLYVLPANADVLRTDEPAPNCAG